MDRTPDLHDEFFRIWQGELEEDDFNEWLRRRSETMEHLQARILQGLQRAEWHTLEEHLGFVGLSPCSVAEFRWLGAALWSALERGLTTKTLVCYQRGEPLLNPEDLGDLGSPLSALLPENPRVFIGLSPEVFEAAVCQVRGGKITLAEGSRLMLSGSEQNAAMAAASLSIGAHVRAQRVKAGLSLREVAEALGISPAALGEIERDRQPPVSPAAEEFGRWVREWVGEAVIAFAGELGRQLGGGTGADVLVAKAKEWAAAYTARQPTSK